MVPDSSQAPLVGGGQTAGKQAASISDNLERLQANILRLTDIACHHLHEDALSRQSVKTFGRFLSIVFKYVECYERLDQLSIRKIRQSLHEFLIPRHHCYSSELYYLFKAKKLLSLLDSVIERNLGIAEAKVNLLKFILEVDFVMLPRAVLVSSLTPKLVLPQPFLWQFGDDGRSSSLREHIVETEVEVRHVGEVTLRDWSIEAELVCTEAGLGQVKFRKKTIKQAQSLVGVSFMLHFESVSRHRLGLTVRLLNRDGFLVDELTAESSLEVY